MHILVIGKKNSIVQDIISQYRIKLIDIDTIRKAALYPFPQVVIVDFEKLVGKEKAEKLLIDISIHLIPKPLIIACMEHWEESQRILANCLKIDYICSSDILDLISYFVTI